MFGALRAGLWKRQAGWAIAIISAVAASALPIVGAADVPASVQVSSGPAVARLLTHRQNVTGPGNGFLASVSCPSASFCAAIDQGYAAVIYNGSGWSKPQFVDPNSFLESVSCPTTTFCVAVDGNGDAVTYNGTTWSAPVSADAGAFLGAVSCPSSAFCAMVSYSGQGVFFDGSNWSAETTVDPAGNPAAVSFASPVFCALVDDLGDVFW